jgi:hypothetical protein
MRQAAPHRRHVADGHDSDEFIDILNVIRDRPERRLRGSALHRSALRMNDGRLKRFNGRTEMDTAASNHHVRRLAAARAAASRKGRAQRRVGHGVRVEHVDTVVGEFTLGPRR